MSAHANDRISHDGLHLLMIESDAPRRLAACWNVCRGYDTELLENIDMVGDTLKDRFDELQKELKAVPLAKKHDSMMVDYSGLLRQARENMKRTAGFQKNMLEQLQVHLEILGKRFYEGDLTVVDEFLQLYCIADEDRKRVVTEQGGVS